MDSLKHGDLTPRASITNHSEGNRLFSISIADESVEIRRTNRATVPRHTLSEAAKLKNPHVLNTATYSSSGLVQLRKFTPGVAYNAIFLEGVKGTVLQADLQMELNPILRPSKLIFGLKVRSSLSGRD
jgi:hypothetical protein